MTKKVKTILIVAIVIVVCSAVFGVTLGLLLKNNKTLSDLNEEQKILIMNGGEIAGEFTLEEILDIVASEEFTAIYKRNGKKAVEKVYEGIELKTLFAALNIDLSGKQSVKFTAGDGLSRVYNISDIMQDNNVFIAFKYEGKAFLRGIKPLLKSDEEDGGMFVVIRASDSVSQSRVRMLVKIEI